MAISKQKDKKFHVEGERMVAPFSLLNNVLREPWTLAATGWS